MIILCFCVEVINVLINKTTVTPYALSQDQIYKVQRPERFGHFKFSDSKMEMDV